MLENLKGSIDCLKTSPSGAECINDIAKFSILIQTDFIFRFFKDMDS